MHHIDSISGKRILVTGGSRGLGKELCQALLESNAEVITTARHTSPEVTHLSQRFKQQFKFIPCDLADFSQLQSFLKSAQLLQNPVDGFIANAAVGTEGMLTMMSSDQIHDSLHTNLHSSILIAQSVLKGMLAHQKSGSLVFISSVCAHHGFKGLSVYAAAKAGLCGFSKGIAREYGPRGIRSNTILPGFLDTDMTNDFSKTQKESIKNRTSLKRLGNSHDVKQTVLHLLSDESSYITGSEFVVDGGFTN